MEKQLRIKIGNLAEFCAYKAGKVLLTVTLRPAKYRCHEFSLCGEIWMKNGRDCISAGQNIEEIAALFPDSRAIKLLVPLWNKYHLKRIPARKLRKLLTDYPSLIQTRLQ